MALSSLFIPPSLQFPESLTKSCPALGCDMLYGFSYNCRLGSAQQRSDEGGKGLAGGALTIAVTEKDEMMFGNINNIIKASAA